MSYNKNGLEVKLDFDYSIKDQDFQEIKDQLNINKIIENNVSTITFLSKPKVIQLETFSYNFPLISQLKRHNDFIINKISKFELLRKPKKTVSTKYIFEIKKNEFINILNTKPNKENEEEKDIKKDVIENEETIKKEIKKFENLNIFNENKIFLSGKSAEKKYDIEYKINNIEIFGKPKEKEFNVMNIDNKIIEIEIINIENKEKEIKTFRIEPIEIKASKKDKSLTIKTYRIEPIEIKGKEKVLDDKGKDIKTYRIEPIEIKGKEKVLDDKGKDVKTYRIEPIEIKGKEKVLDDKGKDVKTYRIEPIEIKALKKEKIFNIESNSILIQINGKEIKPEQKKKYEIQKSINTLQIIQKRKKRKNVIVKNVVNLEIKTQQTKKKEILFKKVDNFISSKDKLQSKNKNIQNINDNVNSNNNNELKDKELKMSKKELNLKIDIYKTKSPNQIKINRIAPQKVINNNFINENIEKENKEKNENMIKTDEKKNINTLNNEIMSNKESVQLPTISNDITHLEKQYEKIKKDLNELYPIFSKNKQYRENFFVQLSQGNQGKYNFYLSLYKIIKDEQEEKKNNNFENYLKMRKIINGKSSGLHNKIKAKLKPLKKNSSSCSIKARNKIFPFYTEGNNNY